MTGPRAAEVGTASRPERISRRTIGVGAGHVELRIASFGRVLVTADAVHPTPSGAVTIEDLLACTRRSVDAARALLRGQLALRGAAVLVPEGAVVFVGGPGSGTSSVAEAYARRRSGVVLVDGVVAIAADAAAANGLAVVAAGRSSPLASWFVLRRSARAAAGPALRSVDASPEDVRDLTFLRDFVPALGTAPEVRAVGARLAERPATLIEAALGDDLAALASAAADRHDV